MEGNGGKTMTNETAKLEESKEREVMENYYSLFEPLKENQWDQLLLTDASNAWRDAREGKRWRWCLHWGTCHPGRYAPVMSASIFHRHKPTLVIVMIWGDLRGWIRGPGNNQKQMVTVGDRGESGLWGSRLLEGDWEKQLKMVSTTITAANTRCF